MKKENKAFLELCGATPPPPAAEFTAVGIGTELEALETGWLQPLASPALPSLSAPTSPSFCLSLCNMTSSVDMWKWTL